MHRTFYASGFLYNSSSQQILLQQSTDQPSQYVALSGKGHIKEKPEAAFQRIVFKFLKIKLKPSQIHLVYDYSHAGLKSINYVFYAEVTVKSRSIKSNFSWFTFKQVTKLPFDAQTKQDIIVTERVMKARARDQVAATDGLATKQ